MKIKGSNFLYENERNEDLMRCFIEKASKVPVLVISEIFDDVVNSPSSRFWVTERRAAVVISNMMRGRDVLSAMKPQRREMYKEIYKRVVDVINTGTRKSLYEIVCDVVSSPAPKFYLTPDSAKIIYYRYKPKWYNERAKRILHHVNNCCTWKK